MKLKSLIAGALCFASLSTTAFASENTIPEPMNKYTPGVNSAPYTKSFTDVQPNDWYYDAVMTLTDGGLLSGYGNGKFGPNDQLTRLQVHTIVGKMSNRKWDGVLFGTLNGFNPTSDTAVADRAFAFIMLMHKAMWGSVTLADNKLTKDTQLTDLEKLVGSNWKDVVKPTGIHTGYSCENIYGTKYPAMSTSFYQPIYDTLYAMGLQNKELNTISSIDELPDAAEIHRWIDENAATISKHCYRGGIWSLDYTKEYCEQLLVYGYNIGLFGGVDDKGNFAPYAPITRAQFAQALFNTGWTYIGAVDTNY